MILVRPIERTDIKKIAVCEGEIFSDASSDSAIDALFGVGAIGVLAETDGEVCGYAYCADAAGDAELLRIAVLPNWRRQGLGARLLREMHGMLIKKGTSRVFLEVRESNTSAHALYTSLGYAEDGKRRNFYSNPREDAVLMSKDLTSFEME